MKQLLHMFNLPPQQVDAGGSIAAANIPTSIQRTVAVSFPQFPDLSTGERVATWKVFSKGIRDEEARSGVTYPRGEALGDTNKTFVKFLLESSSAAIDTSVRETG